MAYLLSQYHQLPDRTNDLKNPRRQIKLVNDLLQTGYYPAPLSLSSSASSLDLKNYRLG
jgi:hypothetical protein